MMSSGGFCQRVRDFMVFKLNNSAASLADQELRVSMTVVGFSAGHKGIESLDFMDQTVFKQKFK